MSFNRKGLTGTCERIFERRYGGKNSILRVHHSAVHRISDYVEKPKKPRDDGPILQRTLRQNHANDTNLPTLSQEGSRNLEGRKREPPRRRLGGRTTDEVKHNRMPLWSSRHSCRLEGGDSGNYFSTTMLLVCVNVAVRPDSWGTAVNLYT
jgi:hypothetical protein